MTRPVTEIHTRCECGLAVVVVSTQATVEVTCKCGRVLVLQWAGAEAVRERVSAGKELNDSHRIE